MSCGHWQSEYDASPCSYCEVDNRAHASKDERIKALEAQLEAANARETRRASAAQLEHDEREAVIKELTEWRALHSIANGCITEQRFANDRADKAAAQQREACAQFIEQASLREGHPIHAERCRATPLVTS